MTNPEPVERLPFSFWLADATSQSAIYMVDSDKQLSQRLNLYIENTENQPLFFSPTNLDTDPVSAQNCHFELRFRRGVLSDSSLGKSAAADREGKSIELLLTGKYQKKAYEIGSWVISGPDDHEGSEPYISFYLARAEKGSGGRFMPGERQRLVLTNISADPEGDTAETRVELVPRKLYYDPPLQKETRHVTEPREQNVKVVSHLGKERIPLHAAFIGAYTVRNDGQIQGAGHQLKLRITNVSRHSTITFNEKSRLLFSFDNADGDEDEALGKDGSIAAIRFYLDRAVDALELDPPSKMDQAPVWSLSKKLLVNRSPLAPHQHLDILLDTQNFITVAPAGLTALHITYEGVPGYWDGKLLAELEKTPLVVREVLQKDQKSIVEMDSGNRTLLLTGNNNGGTSHTRLHVNGRTLIEGNLEVSGDTLLKGQTSIEGKMEVKGDSLLEGQVSIEGKMNMGSDALIKGKATIDGDTLLKGQTSIGGKLEVDGETVLKGKLSIEPLDNLHVTGNTILSGNLNVGGEGNAKITTRHVEGKSYLNSNADHLYLNYHSGKDVYTGYSDRPSSLHVSGRVFDKTGHIMPVGSIIAFGGQNIPTGWLECNGQKIDPDKYKDLCEVLGKIKELSVGNIPLSATETIDKAGFIKKFFGKHDKVTHKYKYSIDYLREVEVYKVPDLRSRFIVGVGQGELLKITEQEISVLSDNKNQKKFKVSKEYKHLRSKYSMHDSYNEEPFASSKPSDTILPSHYALRYIIKC